MKAQKRNQTNHAATIRLRAEWAYYAYMEMSSDDPAPSFIDLPRRQRAAWMAVAASLDVSRTIPRIEKKEAEI